MKIKKLLAQVHLWIGLILGLLFFLISLSGAIYTWAPEISAIIYKQKVEQKSEPFVLTSTIKTTLDREFPEGDFRTVFFRDNTQAIEVLLYGQGTYYYAYLNPYTGALIHIQDMNKGWLNYTKFIHRNLLLGKVGQQIVHWVTLLFLIMTITGIIMWWPVNKGGTKKVLTIKLSSSPKKLNYDLHNVLGFYASWVLIFCIITGLFWGFKVVKDTFRLATGENELTYDIPLSEKEGSQSNLDQFVLMDSLALVYRTKYPNEFVRISNPHKETDPIRVVVISPDRSSNKTQHFYFDRYSGDRINGNFEYGLQAEASMFNTINGLVYDIHFGTVLGLTGRLLVFFASLIAASLPVTGFIIWFGKRKKA